MALSPVATGHPLESLGGWLVMRMGYLDLSTALQICVACRHWVSKNIPLLLDKNPNVRQMAGKALATIYSMDPHTVSALRPLRVCTVHVLASM